MTARPSAVLLLRGVPVALVFVCTILAFEAGVDVSDRPGVGQAGLAAHVYYAVGLFLLGGMDLGMPVGGPPWARAMLWVAYFLGPLITTTAVAEGFLAVVHPRWLASVRLRDHVVVAGVGHIGMLYVDAVRAVDPRARIVVVDLDEGAGASELVRGRHVTFLRGDILRPQVRASLRLHRARALVLTTGSDLHNLEACWDVLGEHPTLKVAVHVSDIGMRRRVGDLEVRGEPRLFNAHQIAAQHLYDQHLARHFQCTDARDVVVLAGFGRFGQTILEYLQSHAQGELARVVIADVAAGRCSRGFAQQVGFDPRVPVELVEGDIDDPRVWEGIAGHLAAHEAPVIVLCTDDDTVNLRAAMLVRTTIPKARAFVRVFAQSAFTDDLAKRLDVEVLAVERLLVNALEAHHRSCIGR